MAAVSCLYCGLNSSHSSLLDQMIPVTCMSWPGTTRFVPIAGTPAQGVRRSDLKSYSAKREVSWIMLSCLQANSLLFEGSLREKLLCSGHFRGVE